MSDPMLTTLLPDPQVVEEESIGPMVMDTYIPWGDGPNGHGDPLESCPLRLCFALLSLFEAEMRTGSRTFLWV